MKKGKKQVTERIPRLSGPRKKELVSWVLRDLLRREPTLTLGQARRVFNYGYYTLRGPKASEEFIMAKGGVS